jgi:hypothetical protein
MVYIIMKEVFHVMIKKTVEKVCNLSSFNCEHVSPSLWVVGRQPVHERVPDQHRELDIQSGGDGRSGEF